MTKKQATEVSQREFGRQEGVTHVAVQHWIRAGMPVTENRKVDPAKARRWLQQNSLRLIDPSAAESIAKSRARREAAGARLKELELGQREGELISAVEAQAAWSNMILTARNRLLALPSKLAPYVAIESDVGLCQQILDREVREALSALAEELGPREGNG